MSTNPIALDAPGAATAPAVPRVGAGRVVFVDLLRGAAAFAVALFHFMIHAVWRYPAQEIPRDSFTYRYLYGNFGMGAFGVALFFIISGYLIPATLESRNATLRRFAIHRFFRLYPAYWISIPGALLVLYLTDRHPNFTPLEIAVNFTMLQGFVRLRDVMGVYWTLQIELILYGVCALLFYFRSLHRRELAFALSLALTTALAAVRFLHGGKIPVAIGFGLTMMFLGDIVRHAESAAAQRKVWGYALIAAAASVPLAWVSYGDRWREYIPAYPLAIAVFVIAARGAQVIERTPWLRALAVRWGETSYGMYLFHTLVGAPLVSVLLVHGAGNVLSVTAGLVVSTLFSFAFFHLLERPCIEFGRKVASGRTVASRAVTSGV